MRKVILMAFGLFWAALVQAQNPQWKEINTEVKASLRGLSPVSGQVCWASGSGGTWLKTLDGGVTWEHGVIAGLDTVDFRSIYAFDEETAVVASAGQPAVVYRTENGGSTWELVHQESAPEAFFDGVAFSGRDKGFLIGDPVDGKWMILETENGGRSWQALGNLPAAQQGEAAFAASASSLIVTKGGLVFGTGGSESNLHFYDFASHAWSKRKTPMIQGQPSEGIFAIVQVGKKIIGVGGDYTKLEQREQHALLYEGGEFHFPDSAPLGYRSGIAFWKKRKLVVAVGPSGSDYSMDQGVTWVNFSPTGYHAVKLSGDQKALWASGSGGRIAKLDY